MNLFGANLLSLLAFLTGSSGLCSPAWDCCSRELPRRESQKAAGSILSETRTPASHALVGRGLDDEMSSLRSPLPLCLLPCCRWGVLRVFDWPGSRTRVATGDLVLRPSPVISSAAGPTWLGGKEVCCLPLEAEDYHQEVDCQKIARLCSNLLFTVSLLII